MKITTLAQLEALPVGSVVLGHSGVAWQRVPHRERMTAEGWFCADPIYPGIYKSKYAFGAVIYKNEPATLMIPATITQEQLADAAETYRIVHDLNPDMPSQNYVAVILSTLGISVEGEDE